VGLIAGIDGALIGLQFLDQAKAGITAGFPILI
jgi:hypothetical protein